MKLTYKSRIYSVKNPIIGITGGIATGKSFICQLLKEKGYPVISADEQIKLIYQEIATINILQEFAPEVLISNSQIDFKKLRPLYFSSIELREKLNKHIYSQLAIQVKEFCHSFDEEQIIFYEVPLLFEKQLQKQVDFSITVYANQDTQIQRIKERDNSSDDTIRKILEAQLPIEQKRDAADFTIDNSQEASEPKSRENLTKQLNIVLEQITRRVSFA